MTTPTSDTPDKKSPPSESSPVTLSPIPSSDGSLWTSAIGYTLHQLKIEDRESKIEAAWMSAIANALEQRRGKQLLRQRRTIRILDSTHLQIIGAGEDSPIVDAPQLVNFASNNYLGLTHHRRVIAAFEQTARMSGTGSGAAPLVSGQSESHRSAETAISRWKGTESSVLLSSGYAANLAVVQMLAATAGARKVRFLLDKLCHASLVDAVRSVATESQVSYRIFPHNHVAKLRRLLQDAEPGVLQVVVTESIFSMDGDQADLAGIASIKKELPFLLVLDEAHGSGVYGIDGSGYASEMGLSKIVDIAIITLSKALGCVGGAVCASDLICQAIVNFGRSYVFSTAIPPAVAAAAEAGIAVLRDEPWRQKRVRELAKRVRRAVLNDHGDSPIIPIILGEEAAALSASEKLKSMGMLVVAVRPPTVPVGSSRLRVTLSCDHSDQEVDGLIAALLQIKRG